MCQIDLDDPCTVWNEQLVGRARKEHVCDQCGGVIIAGSSYFRHFSISDGEPTNEARCLPCETITCAFQREHRYRFTPASMRVMLEECLQEESFYGYDEDERLELSDPGLRWKHALREMDTRRDARGTAA